MIYNDGYETDNNMRFKRCPKCGNEEYSENASYCRICGLLAYNECDGAYEQDEYGNQGMYQVHRNVGNARYCEYCGKPTMLLKEKLLQPYTNVKLGQYESEPFAYDEDLPFN